MPCISGMPCEVVINSQRMLLAWSRGREREHRLQPWSRRRCERHYTPLQGWKVPYQCTAVADRGRGQTGQNGHPKKGRALVPGGCICPVRADPTGAYTRGLYIARTLLRGRKRPLRLGWWLLARLITPWKPGYPMEAAAMQDHGMDNGRGMDGKPRVENRYKSTSKQLQPAAPMMKHIR